MFYIPKSASNVEFVKYDEMIAPDLLKVRKHDQSKKYIYWIEILVTKSDLSRWCTVCWTIQYP